MSKGGRITQLHKVEVTEAAAQAAAEAAALKADLENQLEAATKAQVQKLTQSRDFLISQLDTASKKYLTVNGYMQARSTLEQVAYGNPEMVDLNKLARSTAREMALLANLLADKIREVDVMELDATVLDGHLDTHFAENETTTLADLLRQLLVVNLLQNVGPALDDIIGFRSDTNDAIAKIESELGKTYLTDEAPDTAN